MSREQTVRLAGWIASSRVNGPGRRAVLWVQGCDLACPGCFNPGTHDPTGGETLSVSAIVRRVLSAREGGAGGLTLSGGEPFQQAPALAEAVAQIRAAWPAATVLAFTGYRLERLRQPEGSGAPEGAAALLAQLDWLVDGPYDPRQNASELPWRASRNQRLHTLGRPLPQIEFGLGAEVHIGPAGTVLLSGFPDPRLQRAIGALGSRR